MVRGRTTLRLIDVHRSARGWVTIVGDLRDAQLASGVGGQPVELHVDLADRRLRRVVQTDAHGVFRARWRLPLGTYSVQARFAGARAFAPAALGPLPLDVSKRSLILELRMPELLDAAQPRHAVEVVARAGGDAADVSVVLSAAAKKLAEVRTGAKGRGVVTVSSASLGRPGPVALIASFGGDATFNPTTTRSDGMLVTTVDLGMATPRSDVSADAAIEIRGTARDLLGPVRGGTIGLWVMGRHRATTLTDGAGAFRFTQPAAAYPPGPLDLEARFFPAVLWRRAGAPARVSVQVLAARPIPVGIYAIPVLVTALLFAAALLIRSLPRIRRRREVAEQREPLEPPIATAVRSGLQLSRTRLRALLVQDTGISGIVVDALDGMALGGAVLGLQRAEGAVIELDCDEEGRFAVEDLASGVYRLAVGKPGYVTEAFAVQIPHRGNYRNVRVLLVPVRIRVLEIYRDVALPLLPRRELWARWTPRELLLSLEGGGQRRRALEKLSELLEVVYWGPEIPPETSVRRARDLAALLRGS